MKKRFMIGIGAILVLFAGFCVIGYIAVDYHSAEAIASDYADGGTVVDKTALVKVDSVTNNNYISSFESDGQMFVYSGQAEEAPEVKKGDKIIIKITHITPIFGKYVIGYQEDK